MARILDKQFYRELVDSQLSFIKRGSRSVNEIYDHVLRQFPTLCADDFCCTHRKTNIVSQPEWHHTTRNALSSLKSDNGPVRYSGNRGYWLFV